MLDSHCAVQTSLEEVVDAVELPEADDSWRLGPAADQHWLQHEHDERSRRLFLALGQAMSACLSPLELEMLTGAYGLSSEPPLGVCGVSNALSMHTEQQGGSIAGCTWCLWRLGLGLSSCMSPSQDNMHIGAWQLGTELNLGMVKTWLGICKVSIPLGMCRRQGGSLHLLSGGVCEQLRCPD